MIKKGCLFGFVLLCSLIVLTGCPAKTESVTKVVNKSSVKKDFVGLKETGFVPPVIRLGETYVNDKIESKDKTLSFEYYYARVENDGDFESIKNEDLLAPGCSFHTATIKESDSGDASKTKLKYEKLKAVNGGEICIGTKFVLGLIVKNQNGGEEYKARVDFHVMAPQSNIEAASGKKVLIPGDHTLAPAPSNAELEGHKDGKTTYAVPSTYSDKRIALDFGDHGKTSEVLLKQ